MRPAIVVILATAFLGDQLASAQAVAQAAYDRAEATTPPQQVRFGWRNTKVGDQIEQRSYVQFQLDTTSRRGDEIADQQQIEMRREQRRLITAADVSEGRTTAANLKYVTARKWSGTGGDVPSADALPSEPVEGKSYSCRREGENLIVQYSDGQTPPPAEVEIVALSMETLGQPNLLAEFFAERTMTVGEQVALPPDLADELLGLTKKLGNIVRFELRLDDVAEIEGKQCAMFAATIEVEGTGSRQMRMQIDGTLAIEIDTCRVAKAELSGPLAMFETRGSLTSKYQLISRGRLTVAVQSKYQDVGSYSPATQ